MFQSTVPGARALGPAPAGVFCNTTLQTKYYAKNCMSTPCKAYVFSDFYAENAGLVLTAVCHIGMIIETLAFSAHDLYTLRVSLEPSSFCARPVLEQYAPHMAETYCNHSTLAVGNDCSNYYHRILVPQDSKSLGLSRAVARLAGSRQHFPLRNGV